MHRLRIVSAAPVVLFAACGEHAPPSAVSGPHAGIIS